MRLYLTNMPKKGYKQILTEALLLHCRAASFRVAVAQHNALQTHKVAPDLVSCDLERDNNSPSNLINDK